LSTFAYFFKDLQVFLVLLSPVNDIKHVFKEIKGKDEIEEIWCSAGE
jgi:hypothetical protein